MHRRFFLQSILSLPALTLPRPKAGDAKVVQQQQNIIYTDSQGNPPAVLAALHDGNRQSGGVQYQP